jgi:hypothetical protein
MPLLTGNYSMGVATSQAYRHLGLSCEQSIHPPNQRILFCSDDGAERKLLIIGAPGGNWLEERARSEEGRGKKKKMKKKKKEKKNKNRIVR